MEKLHKYGLVLEGGGMRGLFSAGVMDVMFEAGIRFDGVIGVSAGACFGCNYVSEQPGRALRYNMRYCRDPRYMGLRTLLSTGDLVGAEFAYHVLPTELDPFDKDAFERSATEFTLVTTDVETGHPVYHRMSDASHESLEWMRASASMPIVSRPVKVDDGRLMLDGGISDSIPLEYFQSQGYDRCIVILTQPRDFFKKPVPKWLFRLALRRYPAIAAAMNRRHLMYNSQLHYVAQQQKHGNAFVIAPEKPLRIARTDSNPEKLKLTYLAGRITALNLLPQINNFLNLP